MWMDERGVAHTVALPNPAEVMSHRFRASLDVLVSRRQAEVAGVLERLENGIYEKVSSVPVDGAYERRSPPRSLLDDQVWSEQELEAALEQVDLRWRLDALLAVGEYIS